MNTRSIYSFIYCAWLGVFAFHVLFNPDRQAVAADAGINVSPTSGLVTNENGGTASFFIVLTARPDNPVEIPLSTSDPTEGKLLISLAKFSPGNWNAPQEIFVAGVDDTEADGDILYEIITGPASSRDPSYQGLNAKDVSVLNLNDAKPAAENDAAQTYEDTPVTFNVLANDSGLNDAPLTVSIDTAPPHGTALVVAGNQVTYHPAPNFNGQDLFKYKVCDADGDCSTAEVRMSISAVNDAPSAVDDQASTTVNLPVVVDVLANDADLDGDPLLLEGFQANTSNGGTVTRVDNGTPTNKQDDRLRFTPAAGFSGVDQFTYTASDGSLSDLATVAITVDPGEPVAVDDNYQAVQGVLLKVNSSDGVLNNDLDSRGQGLSAVWVSGPSHGSLDLKSDGSFDYTPDSAHLGNDTFTYKAFDGTGYSNEGTVTIAVLSASGVPLAKDDAFSIGQKEVLLIAAPGVLGNDVDPNGDGLQTALADPPNHGTLILNPNGSFTFTPNGTYVGLDKFIYTASDGKHQSNQATVSIDIKDQINPLVNWVSPVKNGGIFDVNTGMVRLTIEAVDNVGIARVRFYRWDSLDGKYVELVEDVLAPYQFDLTVNSLNLTWNQTFVRSYDKAGNPSEQKFIWLYRTGQPIYLPLLIR